MGVQFLALRSQLPGPPTPPMPVYERNRLFTETPKFVSEKGGFPDGIINFWPKLFGVSVFR